jgi:dihydroorotate dehydrogenase electron transfer subunit
MIQHLSTITAIENVAPDIWVISFHLPASYPAIAPGQFVNVRVTDAFVPLLRRPFSFYWQSPGEGQIIFRVVGEGTRLLARKKIGDSIDILGPLGNAFRTDDDFETGIIVAGGLGVAPMPLLTNVLKNKGKKFVTFVGARSKDQMVDRYLENLIVATEDGSMGSRGTIIQVLHKQLSEKRYGHPKVFVCGPTKMLDAIYNVVREYNISCEVSLEGTMACGMGICQGCPVELTNKERKYALICKDGPVFNIQSLRIPING